MTRTIFFDLDGTLLDSQLGIIRCINYALVKMGSHERDESDLISMIGPPLFQGFSRLLDTDDEQVLNDTIAAYRERYKDQGIFECHLYDGIPELLARLYEDGHSMHLVTAKPERFAKQIIPHHKLDSIIRGIYGPTLEDMRDGKAHLILRALDGEGVELENAVMVGDRNRDILGAKELGMTSIGVTWGYGSPEEMDECQPDSIANNTDELYDIIKKL